MLSACHCTATVNARSVASIASTTPSLAQPTARSPLPRTSTAWVKGVHAQIDEAESIGHDAVAVERHAVRRDRSRRLLAVHDRRRSLHREVLQEGAAAGDVQHLQAAADRQHGQVARLGRAHERDLEEVEVRFGRAERGVGGGPVDRRVQVRAARQAQAAERVQQRLDAVGVQRGDDHRHRTGAADRLGIGQPQRELDRLDGLRVRVVHDALGRTHLRRADADDRARRPRRVGSRHGEGAGSHQQHGSIRDTPTGALSCGPNREV